MARKELVPLLISLMLFTGVCNTLLSKYQDNICVRDCDTPNPKTFEQPVIQTLQMFIGEMGSWLVIGSYHFYKRFRTSYFTSNRSEYQPLNQRDDNGIPEVVIIHPGTPIVRSARSSIFAPEEKLPLFGWRIVLLGLPAVCDICGTTLMNVGLLFVAPSIYQMTRGALVFFVGLFSVIFLKRRLYLFQWFALATVVLGVGIVGLAGASHGDQQIAPDILLTIRETLKDTSEVNLDPNAIRTVIGILLIAAAQVISAIQFVLEEFIFEKFALDPLKVVGWEGIFGFSVTGVVMIFMYLVVGHTTAGRFGYFDIAEGWREITQNKSIGVSSILIMISIGGFNYFGLSVTQNVSATARSTIDTCRTLFIWIVSLYLRWETFKWLQIIGFGLLVYGTFLYNKLIKPPFSVCTPLDSEENLD